MSIYRKIGEYIGKDRVVKLVFNTSPMYRRTTARIIEASKDLLKIRIKMRFSRKNRNYVGTFFGGSMFSAVDPIPMLQLVDALGDDYVVWDKSAQIFFKRPAKEDLYADFVYTLKEIEAIKERVKQENEIEIIDTTPLTNKDRTKTYSEVQKTIYIADKSYYKQKQKARKRT